MVVAMVAILAASFWACSDGDGGGALFVQDASGSGADSVGRARTYTTDGMVRFDIDDPFLPEEGGAFELVVVNGRGTCRRISNEEIDLSLGTVDLACLYLGGNSALALAQAGRIRGADESVLLLGRMFRGDVAPWCEEIF